MYTKFFFENLANTGFVSDFNDEPQAESKYAYFESKLVELLELKNADQQLVNSYTTIITKILIKMIESGYKTSHIY